MAPTPEQLLAYYKAGKPLVCEIDVQPWLCEFWPLDALAKNNEECEVDEYAPGYFGFATSGGGEMYAISPTGAVVCLAFIGMSPKEELHVADSWPDFERLLRSAL
jgi:hypothetical protein